MVGSRGLQQAGHTGVGAGKLACCRRGCASNTCSPACMPTFLCPGSPVQVESERDEMRRQFEGAVLQAQQASALRAAVLERRLEAAGSELVLARQASVAGGLAGGGGGGGRSRQGSAALATGGSKAKLAAQQGEAEFGSSSRRGSQAEPSAAGAGTGSSSDWVKALLEAALHTPLPDQDAALIEDDAPRDILQHIAQLEAAGGGEEVGAGSAVGGRRPCYLPQE